MFCYHGLHGLIGFFWSFHALFWPFDEFFFHGFFWPFHGFFWPFAGLFGPFAALVTIIPFWRICDRVGLSPWLSLLLLVPLANIIFVYFVAFGEWPLHRGNASGVGGVPPHYAGTTPGAGPGAGSGPNPA